MLHLEFYCYCQVNVTCSVFRADQQDSYYAVHTGEQNAYLLVSPYHLYGDRTKVHIVSSLMTSEYIVPCLATLRSAMEFY